LINPSKGDIKMQSIKTLLAIAVLSGAGVTHAATVATFNVSETGTSAFTSQLLTGTAVLDDSGILTETLVGTVDASALNLGIANVTTTNVFNGTIAGGVFTANSGTSTVTSCVSALSGCALLSVGVATTLTTATGSISLAGGGSLVGTVTASGITLTATDTLTPVAAPAVPVPAAAWLFGSGLLGLAGVTRRRRA
jgi:hypothetical protein